MTEEATTGLDIDEATQKRLMKADIIDVEGVLEAGEAKVAKVLGDRAQAAVLVARARHVLGLPDPKSPTLKRKRSAPKKRRR